MEANKKIRLNDPAPGSYNISRDFYKNEKKFTFGQKYPRHDDTSNPGPG